MTILAYKFEGLRYKDCQLLGTSLKDTYKLASQIKRQQMQRDVQIYMILLSRPVEMGFENKYRGKIRFSVFESPKIDCLI